MKKSIKIVISVILVLVLGVFAFAKINRISPLAWGHKEVNQATFDKTAINGYDPVGYFTDGKAIKGNAEISYEWKGANWQFASDANKEMFIGDPEKYMPAFGGYCAFAVCKGFTANTDPESFEIIDGKLYLFAANDVKADWMKEAEINLKLAGEHWK